MIKKRNIVLDTETTGLSINEGHRIIEIGCVELINDKITGEKFHTYINPERSIPIETTLIHGITDSDVQDQPIFAEIADEFLSFIGDSTLIIHNAGFDISFLNHELKNINKKTIQSDKAIDTLEIARKYFPGERVSLNALCKKFNISLESRKMHGALIDSLLLAEVYFFITKKMEIQSSLNLHQNTKIGLSIKIYLQKKLDT